MEKFIEFVTIALFMLSGTVLFSVIFAFPEMWLWNATIPDIFGLPEVNIWQMIRLSFLATVFFKSGSSNISDSK